MRRLSVCAAVLLTLFMSGCSSEPPKEKENDAGADPIPLGSAVPFEIRNQLLTAQDIRDGATLKSEAIELDETRKRLLISGDGPTLCSPTGNCPHWIFRQTPAGYEMEVDLDVAQEVSVHPGKTKFPEVLARQHGSATDSELRVYRFDGTRYRLAKCMSESYVDPANPERVLEEPIVTEIQGCTEN